VPLEAVVYVAHDTARVAAGSGSHSGRSMKLATTIIGKATEGIIQKGRKIASFLLDTGEIDLELECGRYRIAGTDREVGIFELPRPQSPARTCQRICKGHSPPSPIRRFQLPASPTAPKSAKSRSIPTQARCKSTAMLQLMMSGAPSIR
jgi:carbon-monoxide dehydrogenase large subunit